MAVRQINIIQALIAELRSDELIFWQQDMTVGTVVDDAGWQPKAERRRLTLSRDSRSFSIELGFRQEHDELLLLATVYEQGQQEHQSLLGFAANEEKIIIRDISNGELKESQLSFIRRYAPQLFAPDGTVILGEISAAEEAAAVWRRFVLYAVLAARAKAVRSKQAKVVFHTKFKPEPERELEFAEANRGAILSAVFFFLLLAAWFIWLRE